ncbi:MAG: VWA domain-containing protein [Acidobacteria bacterium]|nr:VWA domain-containing protein [Acidobacteriota bacterium]
MKRFIVALFVTSALVLSAFLQAEWQQSGNPNDRDEKKIEEPVEKPKGQTSLRVAVEQVRVDVVVKDKDGNLIQGLTKENFHLAEDSVPQEITNFTPNEAPMTTVLLVEYSNVLPWEFLYEVLLASYTFVDQLRSEDWTAVVAYDIKPEILADFTQSKAEIHGALRRLNYPGFRESNLYDALIDTLDRLEENEGKTAVVLVSSGLDTFSKANLDKTLERVKKTEVVIYPVSIGGNFRLRYDPFISDSARMDFYQADATLKAFARYSGGEAFFPRFSQEFNNIFDTIAKFLRHQYTLAYVSTNKKRDGKFRKIKVDALADLNNDGKPEQLKVQHREGYLAPKSKLD